MHVIVLGAGIIGISSAYYLSKSGCQVTVIDRQNLIADETSFGNGGQISPATGIPWPAPSMPFTAIKWLLQKQSPFKIYPDGSLWQLQWLLKMWRNCSTSRFQQNYARMYHLSEYSRQMINQLTAETGIHFEQRQKGILELFRTEKQLKNAQKDAKRYHQLNVPHRFLNKEALMTYEPALNMENNAFTGGIEYPQEQTGNCHLFCQNLAKICESQGVDFKLGQTVESIEYQNQNITGVRVGGQLLTADAYAICLASYTRPLLLPLGIHIPIYPMKGYSITIPIKDESKAPVSSIMDVSYKMVITRFDKTIRVAGMGDVVGFNLSLPQKKREMLEYVFKKNFPDAGDIAASSFWTGLRPVIPTGIPCISQTKFNNLFINSGHGTLGWTMSCGSARLLHDLILHKQPELNPSDYSAQPYQTK